MRLLLEELTLSELILLRNYFKEVENGIRLNAPPYLSEDQMITICNAYTKREERLLLEQEISKRIKFISGINKELDDL